jgi:hypothetical protein
LGEVTEMKKISVFVLVLLLSSVCLAPLVFSEEQQVSGSAVVSAVPYPPIVQSIVPSMTEWIPYSWVTVTVTVQDQDMNLENIYLMAYESSLDNTAPDSTRNHYTWAASRVADPGSSAARSEE